jgi:hypothetical protein
MAKKLRQFEQLIITPNDRLEKQWIELPEIAPERKSKLPEIFKNEEMRKKMQKKLEIEEEEKDIMLSFDPPKP